MIDVASKNSNNEKYTYSLKNVDNNCEKTSARDSNKDNSEIEKSSNEASCDESEKVSESSHECNCEMSHVEDGENHHVTFTQTTQMIRKNPDSHFYEKQLLAKKENEKKYEIIRKRKEEEAKNRAKPVIDEGSKKIMEKKQGYVKPIYQRAKEIEESKKNKIATIKKGIEEKKAKIEEDDLLKSKYMTKNKHYNEKEFEDWRNNQLKWETEKKKKIQHIKDQNQKNQLESLSKFYHPSIDKKSENLAMRSKVLKGNENGKNVFEKLYNQNEERQKKLMQKTIEALPEFKPHINKRVPNYLRSRPNSQIKNTSYFFPSDSKIASTTKNNKNTSMIDVSSSCKTDKNTNYNSVSISQSERTQKSRALNASTIETYNNPIILSDSENENEDENQEKEDKTKVENPVNQPDEHTADIHEDVVSKYKKALQNSNRTPSIITKTINEIKANEISNLSMQSKNTCLMTEKSNLAVNKVVNKPKQIPGVSTMYSSDRNKEKIEMYNQKIAALLSCLKKTEKKK